MPDRAHAMEGRTLSEQEAQVPDDFRDWLAEMRLSHYLDSACTWWVQNGAATMDEVFENWEDFADDLDLKKLERKRIEKDVACRARGGASAVVPNLFRSELAEWLERARLSYYSEQSFLWCEEHNVAAMTDLWARWEDFASDLDLKPFERKRIEKEVNATSAATTTVAKAAVRQSSDTFGPPEDPFRYKLLEEIGCGVTSKCQCGQSVYAAKAIRLTKLRRQPGFARVSERLHQEISILLSLKHSRVVKLIDVVEEHDCLYLVMELVEGGELAEWIVKMGSFSELTARYVFMQMVEGLTYIHSKDIIHRDLKPDNVLVDEVTSRQDLLEVKLSDFGHSRLVNDGYNLTLTARVGTAMYWAPEISDPAKAALGYDQTVDLWSLGVVLYVMLVGFFPFDRGDHTAAQLEHDVSALCFRRRRSGPELTVEAQSLIRSLLQLNPKDRLPLKDCLNHSWVTISGGAVERMGLMKLHTSENPSAVEVRVPLTIQPGPDELHELRCDLQQWMHKFKYFAAIRRGEVIANLGEAAQADLPENRAARSELQAIVERHCGRGMIVVNDQKMWTAIAEWRAAGGQSVGKDPVGTPSTTETPLVCQVLERKCKGESEFGNKAIDDVQKLHDGQGLKRGPSPVAFPPPALVPAGIANNVASIASAAYPSSALIQAGSPLRPQQKVARPTEPQVETFPESPPPELQVARPQKVVCEATPACLASRAGAEDEKLTLAALQGLWAHQSDATETYRVRGFGVVRSKSKASGFVEKRNYTLRWNAAQCCMEWGTGKYVFWPPQDARPLDFAAWVLKDGGSGGFTWRRVPEVNAAPPALAVTPCSTNGRSWVPCAAEEDRISSKGSKYRTYVHTLRVHDGVGAGLNLKGERHGMRIKSIHPQPGQPGLLCDDLIYKIGDMTLSGTPDEVEDMFG
eukprot:CAMPEP_0117622902 /NCGR_PEP_ID=MMETSP0784-20121206/88377_1 /TAXON_ID=39447 /ORGANISM="" /LENGTH=914 /DNA_ID=CAMNT_0005426849 /DNA_START=69 /DNA_END=2809 /DNA_ORIENTATION=+